MYFVNGYLAVMALESEEIKQLMLAHLQELMDDGVVYGCFIVLLYTTWPGSNTWSTAGQHGGTVQQCSSLGIPWCGTRWHHPQMHYQHPLNLSSSSQQATEVRRKLAPTVSPPSPDLRHELPSIKGSVLTTRCIQLISIFEATVCILFKD